MLNWKCFMDIISFHIFLCISYLEKNGFIKSHCVTQIKTDIHTDYAVFMKRTYFNYFFYTVISLQQSLFCCTFFQLGSFLFGGCGSFVCSVQFFCLQCAFFSQSLSCLQYAGVLFAVYTYIFFTVSSLFAVCRSCFFRRVLYLCKELFYLQCFLFVKVSVYPKFDHFSKKLFLESVPKYDCTKAQSF